MPDTDVETATIKVYEASYKRMWEEIGRARQERDRALNALDAAHDLAIALGHDFQTGTTVASLKTHDAFNALRSRLRDVGIV